VKLVGQPVSSGRVVIFVLKFLSVDYSGVFSFVFIGQAWLDAKQQWKRERMEDWSELNGESLRAKLIERKVLNCDENEKAKYSEGLVNLCRGCELQKNPTTDRQH
jgi:hypothetical protein